VTRRVKTVRRVDRQVKKCPKSLQSEERETAVPDWAGKTGKKRIQQRTKKKLTKKVRIRGSVWEALAIDLQRLERGKRGLK